MKLMKKFLFALLVCAFCMPAFAEEREGLTYTDPYMVSLNPANEMNIIWLTKEPCEGVVEYGTTPQMGNFVNAAQYEIKGMRTSATPEG
jgi:hypothetical protein